jgi:CRP/FNR family transcriptional regulator
MSRVLPFIQSHAILGALSLDNQEKLAAGASVRAYDPGERIFAQGDPSGACFALINGAVKVYQQSIDGKEVFVKILTGGELFGEVALFSEIPFPAHAEAIEPCAVVRIERNTFLQLLAQEGFRNDFIKNILDKLRYLTSRVFTLMAHDVEERFFRYVLETWGKSGCYRVTIAKKDFALAIGTIPETFSRLIQRLKTRGAIRWEGDVLEIDNDSLSLYQE